MLIHNNYFNNTWNFLITLSSSFLAIFIPLDIIYGLRDTSVFPMLNYIVSLIMICDIVLNFFRAAHNSKNDVFDEHFTTSFYIRRWLIVDVLAALPLGLILGPGWQLLRMVKLWKVIHFMRQLRHKEVQYAYILSLVFFFFWILHFCHWIACGWLALRAYDPLMDTISNYILALYWSVTTMTTVGYGDITPTQGGHNNIQIIYTIFVEFLGVGLYGYLIGNIASLLTKKDPAKTQYLDNLEKLGALIQYRNPPKELQTKVRDYFTYLWKKRMGYDESCFLDSLPPNLKREIALCLKREVIEKIPLFQDAGKDFLEEVAIYLEPVVLTPGDYIFKAGDEGHEMFFIVRGECLIFNKEEDQLFATLREGDFFGEVALFKKQPRNATIKSVGYCDLYKLEKSVFDMVISHFPEIGEKIYEKAKFRGA